VIKYFFEIKEKLILNFFLEFLLSFQKTNTFFVLGKFYKKKISQNPLHLIFQKIFIQNCIILQIWAKNYTRLKSYDFFVFFISLWFVHKMQCKMDEIGRVNYFEMSRFFWGFFFLALSILCTNKP